MINLAATSLEKDLELGGQIWRARLIDQPHPNEIFDVSICLEWSERTLFVYTQNRFLHGLLHAFESKDFHALSNEERALVLEHVLSKQLEKFENIAASKITILQVSLETPVPINAFKFDERHPIIFMELKNASAFSTLLIELNEPAAAEQLQNLLTPFFQTVDQKPPENMPPPSTAHALMRVAMGPALIEADALFALEHGDLIELNLPASTEMDAIIIDDAGMMFPILLQNGQAILRPGAPPLGPIRDSGAFLEFAQIDLSSHNGQSIPITPLPNGEVLVLFQGQIQWRGRFVSDQGRLGVMIEKTEPQG